MTLDEILASGKPYFGDFLIAGQGPYEDYLPHFKNLVRLVKKKQDPLVILEVGSWAGGSLAVWNEATSGHVSFVVVEQWKPYLNDPGSECHQIIDEAARNGSIEKLFWHNINVLGLDAKVYLMRGPSHLMLQSRPPSTIDIAFIDADHRYASAKTDIELAMPLVREGGILCGDDLQVQLSEILRHSHLTIEHNRYLDENRPNAHLSDGRFYHPGVTQAVADLFVGRLPTAGRLWAVEKVGGLGWVPLSF